MGATMSASRRTDPLANGDIRPKQAKADLPVGENREFRAELREIGEALDYARRRVGWSHDQLAAELKRDPKQVGRWMRGEERTQVDVVLSVKELRQVYVLALAETVGCEIETLVRVRVPWP